MGTHRVGSCNRFLEAGLRRESKWPVSPGASADIRAYRGTRAAASSQEARRGAREEVVEPRPRLDPVASVPGEAVVEDRQLELEATTPGSPRDSLSQRVAAGEHTDPGHAEAEDAREPITIRAPYRVSREEREQHELTHIPYRAWCPYCVRGRGRNSPHCSRSEELKRSGVPRISLDYFFMSTKDEVAHENPLIVMLDEATGERYARAVGRKGMGQDGEMDWLVKDMAEELRVWGHAGGESGHIILKSDGERAIAAVRDALAKYHGGKVVVELPPRGESQSNGAIEEAGKTVREYVRVLKEQVEQCANIELEAASALTAWMVRWAAMLYSRYAVGRDGLTPFERRRGRKCRVPVVKFGEKVWYRAIRDHKERRDKLESEWHQGIWLGHSRCSNEQIIGTREGTVRAYSMKRLDHTQCWDGAYLQELRGTPQQPDPLKPGIVIPIKVRFDPPVEEQPIPSAQEPQARQVRRMRISAPMLEKYGYSEACEGCRFRRAGLGESRNHTEECRSRIEKAMENDDEGRRKTLEQEERIRMRIAEQVQAARRDGEVIPDDAGVVPRDQARGGSGQGTSSRSGNVAAGSAELGVAGPSSSGALRPEGASVGGGRHRSRSRECGGATGVVGSGAVEGLAPAESGKPSAPTCRSGSRSRSPPRARRLEPEIDPADVPVPGSPIEEDAVGVKREAAPEELGQPKRARAQEESDGASMDLGFLAKTATRQAGDISSDSDSCSLRHMVTVGPRTTMSGNVATDVEETRWAAAWDDVSGQELDPRAVAQARATELEHVEKMGVWKLIPRNAARANGWKVVPTRWIDVNKGDKERPNYRSRLVAKEFNTGAEEGLFAATPPLEAVRLLLSIAATTEDLEGGGDQVVMINDVSRAFFEAPAHRPICVEVPAEAKVGIEGDVVGYLHKSLYGTRDAAANFQHEVAKFMKGIGYIQSRYSPSIFYHPVHHLRTLVHGDDFMTAGARAGVQWLQQQLATRFTISTKIVGNGTNEVREARLLGRIVRLTPEGWEYEADQRHAELLAKSLNLEAAKGVKSPGEDAKPQDETLNGEPLLGKEASEYRALAARANYLAQDRSDIAFAAKECCRGMALPTRGDLRRLRRLARYLLAVPRVVWKFGWQRVESVVMAFSDSDWAGCRRTARSTSGGVLMRGSHCLRAYSVTQKHVTLSSAEAELMAIVRASTEAIGMAQMAETWCVSFTARVLSDSAAALAITARKGCGKLRHVRIGELWIQEASESGTISYRKVRGTLNPADLLTKYLSGPRTASLSAQISQFSTEGSAQSKLALDALAMSGGRPNPAYARGGVTAGTSKFCTLSTDATTLVPCLAVSSQ